MEELPEGYIHLFSTLTGSHVWNMQHGNSDKDLFVCYAAPSTDFLIGKTHNKGHHSTSESVDRTSMEIGKVVNQVLKGNVNYLVYVLSPVIEFTTPQHKILVNLTYMNLSRKCYGSIRGFAYGEFKNKVGINNEKDTQKVRRSIMRTINFGITLLGYGVVEFTPVLHDVEIKEIENGFKNLDHAYEHTVLPDESIHEKEMFDFLLNIRMKNLCENV